MFNVSHTAEGYAVDEVLKFFGETPDLEVHTHFEGGAPLTVEKDGKRATITYGKPVELFRGLGLLKEKCLEESFRVEQSSKLKTNGVMPDCSRNGVLSIASAKLMVRHMALMGLDMLMLYTEDTFEVPEYPYFGYMRGRYTQNELRELCRYASGFGIELVPNIQTLAHMPALMRWYPFMPINDIDDILLADDERTYELIDAMIRSCRDSFTTDRIHIGMDEAHLMGRGKYQDKHGEVDRTELLCRHLKKVMEICEKYGFKPMMWSDMFFRLAYGDYYEEGTISPEAIEKIPKDIALVYWDYYATEYKDYEARIKRHLQLGTPLVFAGGSWRWCGLAPAIRHSLDRSRLALDACLKYGIEDVFITAWGDNGSECSFFTILPVMQLYAEYAYTGKTDDDTLAVRLKTCTYEVLQDMLLLDLPNQPGGKLLPSHTTAAKYLLYNDVLCGMLDRHVLPEYGANYAKYASDIKDAALRSASLGYIYDMITALCLVLELKSDIGVKIKRAYDDGDRELLREIAATELPELHSRLDCFHETLFKQWMTEAKPFGYEVLDIRVAGVKARVNTAIARINAYLAGEICKIEELEEARLLYNTAEDDVESTHANLWDLIVSAGVVAGV